MCKLVEAQNGCEANKVPKPALTVGQVMDEAIKEARERVERLCIRKAKLEAMNLLDHPFEELTSLFDRW